MNIEEAIVNRRAIYPKQFSGEIVPNNIIDKMLEMANWAPTHKHTEPWRFHVYEGQAKNDLLELCKTCYVKETDASKFKPAKVQQFDERKDQVSHIVAICMKRHEIIPEFEEIAAVAMAVQNMWTYLSSTEKYGGYWSTPNYSLGPQFHNFLNLDSDERCLGIFYVGTIKDYDDLPNRQRSGWKEKVVYRK